jgi:hypothetical protein
MNDQFDDTARQADVTVIRNHEETLIPDARARLTPAQMVERKLVSTLQRCPLMVSHLQTNSRYRH